MKNSVKNVILLVFLFVVLTSCRKEETLRGVWTRIDDPFTGMKIEVVNVGDILHGKIIEVNGTSRIYGFAEGDIKWKEIRHIGDNKYEYYDLMKSVDMLGNIKRTSYDPALLTKVNDTLIEIRMYAKGLELLGTEQRWVKVKEKQQDSVTVNKN